MKRSEYLSLRRRYEPGNLRLVIIAESPPASGKYFYDPEGRPSEPLFAALMRRLGHFPLTKEAGLGEFQRAGWVLVDATYEPINGLSDSARDRIIERDYPLLLEDLNSLIADRSIPLVLIKANVCRLLELKLAEDGFNVLNQGHAIYFPSTGRQKQFEQQFATILNSGEIPKTNPVPPGAGKGVAQRAGFTDKKEGSL